MNRYFWPLIFALGCVSADQRPADKPLVIDPSKPVTYAEAVTNLRTVGNQMIVKFYQNEWKTLADTATSLERAAESLKTAKPVPDKLNGKIGPLTEELRADAGKLRELAQTPGEQRVNELNDLIQRINNRVRDLRYEN